MLDGLEYPPIYRFQPIADVGERPGHDDAHGAVEIRIPDLLVYVNQPRRADVHTSPFCRGGVYPPAWHALGQAGCSGAGPVLPVLSEAEGRLVEGLVPSRHHFSRRAVPTTVGE